MRGIQLRRNAGIRRSVRTEYGEGKDIGFPFAFQDFA
jgi:hypothetical protein